MMVIFWPSTNFWSCDGLG